MRGRWKPSWRCLSWRTIGLSTEDARPLTAAGLHCLGHLADWLDAGNWTPDLPGVSVAFGLALQRSIAAHREAYGDHRTSR